MKLTRNNARILFQIVGSWMNFIFLVWFSKPSKYLGEIILEQPEKPQLSPEKWQIVMKVVKGTRRISPFMKKGRRCLMQALTVNRALRKNGIQSDFKIGTGKENDQLMAHAWIEIEGKVLIGGAVSGYKELVKTR